MTDTESTSDSQTEPLSDLDEDRDDQGRSIAIYAQWAAFAILVLVALVATFRFYFAASEVIREFVTRQYRPLFQAGFNLVILLAAATGISVLVRRLT